MTRTRISPSRGVDIDPRHPSQKAHMPNHEADFMSPQEHFDRLLNGLDSDQLSLFQRMKNTRVETAFRGRTFTVYNIMKREANVLDTLTVRDFECNDDDGASTLVQSANSGTEFEVGYTPVQVPGYHVFLYLPLHAKLRWSTHAGNVNGGSMAFPLLVRTMSRKLLSTGNYDLREKGVTYCETGVEYAREFEGLNK